MVERTNKDYAIEFGDHLANSAEDFLRFVNDSGTSAHAPDQPGLTDHWRSLQSAIYEFRKCAAKARANQSE